MGAFIDFLLCTAEACASAGVGVFVVACAFIGAVLVIASAVSQYLLGVVILMRMTRPFSILVMAPGWAFLSGVSGYLGGILDIFELTLQGAIFAAVSGPAALAGLRSRIMASRPDISGDGDS